MLEFAKMIKRNHSSQGIGETKTLDKQQWCCYMFSARSGDDQVILARAEESAGGAIPGQSITTIFTEILS